MAPDLLSAEVIVVVPAYNEAQTISRVVAALTGLYRTVVVDDGSADSSGQLAWAAGATVLRHPVNLGQGAALATGIRYALDQGATAIVTFDADGQHDPADIARMLGLLHTDNVDVVLGSRFLGQAIDMPPARRAMLRLATWLTRRMTGMKLTDTHNGLRAFSSTAARKITIRQNGMAHASEILSRIASNRLRWAECPVTISYTEYSQAKGQSVFGGVAILFDLAVAFMMRAD